ncbi:MAG: hypothetical protein RL188_589, partial [Bacteroidota bacterium]
KTPINAARLILKINIQKNTKFITNLKLLNNILKINYLNK